MFAVLPNNSGYAVYYKLVLILLFSAKLFFIPIKIDFFVNNRTNKNIFMVFFFSISSASISSLFTTCIILFFFNETKQWIWVKCDFIFLQQKSRQFLLFIRPLKLVHELLFLRLFSLILTKYCIYIFKINKKNSYYYSYCIDVVKYVAYFRSPWIQCVKISHWSLW